MENDGIIFVMDSVYVYGIPDNFQNPKGGLHRASRWNTVDYLWVGKLIVKVGAFNRCYLQLEDQDEGTWAQALLEGYPSPSCKAVVDSSRYFAVKLQYRSTGLSAMMGLGFCSAADSKRLQESLRIFFSSKETNKRSAAEIENLPVVPPPPKVRKQNEAPIAEVLEGEREFSCVVDGCKCKFPYEFHRHIHQAQLHLYKECPFCNCPFTKNRKHAQRHILDHEKVVGQELRISCAKCTRKFLSPVDYKMHLPSEQKRILTCPFCDNWRYVLTVTVSDKKPKETGLKCYDDHLQQVHPEVFQQKKMELPSVKNPLCSGLYRPLN